jgi:hypothetical protein
MKCFEEKKYFALEIMLHPASKYLSEEFEMISKKDVILYGYGNRGKMLHQELSLLGINIIEIWDQKLEQCKEKKGIVFTRAHSGLPGDIPVLIAIDNRIVAIEVEIQLKELGYQNYWHFAPLYNAVKYRKYQLYLPEVIQYYRELE